MERVYNGMLLFVMAGFVYSKYGKLPSPPKPKATVVEEELYDPEEIEGDIPPEVEPPTPPKEQPPYIPPPITPKAEPPYIPPKPVRQPYVPPPKIPGLEDYEAEDEGIPTDISPPISPIEREQKWRVEVSEDDFYGEYVERKTIPKPQYGRNVSDPLYELEDESQTPYVRYVPDVEEEIGY